MTAEDLRKIGESLYGKNWQTPLAQALGIDRTTVWRYIQRNHVPKPVALAIQAILEKAR